MRSPTTGADLWFQIYWLRDQDRLERLIGRAEKAGCSAIAVTVDLPIMGRRLRDVRNEFTLPAQVIAANLVDDAEDSGSARRTCSCPVPPRSPRTPASGSGRR